MLSNVPQKTIIGCDCWLMLSAWETTCYMTWCWRNEELMLQAHFLLSVTPQSIGFHVWEEARRSLTNWVRKLLYLFHIMWKLYDTDRQSRKSNVWKKKNEKNEELERARREQQRKPKMAIKSRPFSVSLARDTKYLFFPCWKMEKYSKAHRSRLLLCSE